MDTLPITTPQTQSSAASIRSATQDVSSLISSDFETFLQMMTTQARYQDPLEPIDSSEYASQLAQFSMVEQQVQTNDLLSRLTGALGDSALTSLYNWIGMEALSTAPVYWDGNQVTVAPSPASAADKAELVVYDANGAEVQRIALPLSDAQYQWTGTGADGTPLVPGVYTLKVESYANNELLSSEPASSYARITEARLEDGGTTIILAGNISIEASAVSGLRENA